MAIPTWLVAAVPGSVLNTALVAPELLPSWAAPVVPPAKRLALKLPKVATWSPEGTAVGLGVGPALTLGEGEVFP
jgi:hypothetical protein